MSSAVSVQCGRFLKRYQIPETPSGDSRMKAIRIAPKNSHQCSVSELSWSLKTMKITAPQVGPRK